MKTSNWQHELASGRLGPRQAQDLVMSSPIGTHVERVDFISQPTRFFFQNMALLPSVFYRGRDRDGAIDTLVKHLKAVQPDVIGLCEVFSAAERRRIQLAVGRPYASYHQGGPRALRVSEGGLLVLSRYPLQHKHSTVFQSAAGWDQVVAKGALSSRVTLAPGAVPIDFVFTHLQDIAPRGGEQALIAQLRHLAAFAGGQRGDGGVSLVVGDLNWPAARPGYEKHLLAPMGPGIDLWAARFPNKPGYTVREADDFAEDPSPLPSQDQRLDYALQAFATTRVVAVRKFAIPWVPHGAHPVSDHAALSVELSGLYQLVPKPLPTSTRAWIRLLDVTCFRSTDGLGRDDVRLMLTAGRKGKQVEIVTPVMNIGAGEKVRIPTSWVPLPEPGGGGLPLRITGKEVDTLSQDDSLGSATQRLGVDELALGRGRTQRVEFPLLSGSGGLYGVTAEVQVNK